MLPFDEADGLMRWLLDDWVSVLLVSSVVQTNCFEALVKCRQTNSSHSFVFLLLFSSTSARNRRTSFLNSLLYLPRPILLGISNNIRSLPADIHLNLFLQIGLLCLILPELFELNVYILNAQNVYLIGTYIIYELSFLDFYSWVLEC